MKKREIKIFTSLFLALLIFATSYRIIHAEENDEEYGHLYWGINDNTFYLSPTSQGYAINQDDYTLVNLSDGLIYCPMWLVFSNEETQCMEPRDLNNITTVEILVDGDMKITPKNMSEWFYNFTNLKEVNGLENIDYSRLEWTSNMFDGCSSLEYIDASLIDVSNVEYMECMFRNCSSLNELDLSNWDTKNVKEIYSIFSGCSELKNINILKFDLSNVSNVSNIFCGCENIKNIDISLIKFNKTMNFNYMFYDCHNLEKVIFPNNLKIKIKSMEGLFNNCYMLQEVDFPIFEIYPSSTPNIKNSIDNMFNNCSSLEEINISSLSTKNIESMNNMFSGCTSLKKIIVSDKWDIDNKEIESNDMFLGCTNLVGQSGTKYDDNHIDATYAKVDEGETNPGYFTTINDNINKPTDSNIDNEHKPVVIEEKESISISTICTIAIPTLLALLIVGLILNKKRIK